MIAPHDIYLQCMLSCSDLRCFAEKFCRDLCGTKINHKSYIGGFVVEGFFCLQVVTFLSTLTANYGPLLHFSTAFNWLPSDIMSWALGKSNFWTRQLR